MQTLNRDLLNTIPTREAAVASMTVIDALQDYPAEHQLVALTAAYKLMTERFNISPQDVFTVADNVMHHADGRRAEFAAIADYLAGEL
jgi:glucose-6-phosphate isomerase